MLALIQQQILKFIFKQPSSTHNWTKMQPSIKMFFKPSPAVEKKKKTEEEKPDEIRTASASLEENDNGNKATKRPLENDDDSDNKCQEKNKRLALSPTTPKMTLPKTTTETTALDDESKQNKQVMEKGDSNRSSQKEKLATPVKQISVPKPEVQPTPPTPLIDINVVIRKKIANGAYALHENIGVSWFRALQNEFDKPYFKNLSKFVREQRQNKVVYPPENKVYTWTHHHDIKDTRVVILGQDPYHGMGQAHGLSFSVTHGVRTPPSLVNIFKELESDITGFKSPPGGDLTGWAKQGVLLLNTCLSVNQGQANSHQNKGWETFTDAVILWISKNIKHKVVFLLWGRPAQKKASIIDKRHKVLTAAHPSPLSAHNGFFGCSHFSQTNKFLREQNVPEIDWKAL